MSTHPITNEGIKRAVAELHARKGPRAVVDVFARERLFSRDCKTVNDSLDRLRGFRELVTIVIGQGSILEFVTDAVVLSTLTTDREPRTPNQMHANFEYYADYIIRACDTLQQSAIEDARLGAAFVWLVRLGDPFSELHALRTRPTGGELRAYVFHALSAATIQQNRANQCRPKIPCTLCISKLEFDDMPGCPSRLGYTIIDADDILTAARKLLVLWNNAVDYECAIARGAVGLFVYHHLNTFPDGRVSCTFIWLRVLHQRLQEEINSIEYTTERCTDHDVIEWFRAFRLVAKKVPQRLEVPRAVRECAAAAVRNVLQSAARSQTHESKVHKRDRRKQRKALLTGSATLPCPEANQDQEPCAAEGEELLSLSLLSVADTPWHDAQAANEPALTQRLSSPPKHRPRKPTVPPPALPPPLALPPPMPQPPPPREQPCEAAAPASSTRPRQSPEHGAAECVVCFSTDSKRAFLSCGCARTCPSCATAALESSDGRCPSCRAEGVQLMGEVFV